MPVWKIVPYSFAKEKMKPRITEKQRGKLGIMSDVLKAKKRNEEKEVRHPI
jgi:predicted transcriptional regulator